MRQDLKKDMEDPERFVITMELVPGEQSRGRSVDMVMNLAEKARADGRVSAVTITDNPGGHPSLSPDVLGRDIVKMGMDVMVHFACRDQNRVGMESRALQLGHMGINNILALTGDFSGEGFGGQGAPVFDLDSVSLIHMLRMMDEGTLALNDREHFFVGSAVSPFKQTEAETLCQYMKLRKKVQAGARFAITQVGYDVRKFHELMCIQRDWGMQIPTLGSLYLLTPGAARVMASGKIPGAVVPKGLYTAIQKEWQDRTRGHEKGVERAARLAVVLKGLGYKGVHVGGIHRHFAPLARIFDRMSEIESRWREFIPQFDFPHPGGFYYYQRDAQTGLCSTPAPPTPTAISPMEKGLFQTCRFLHRLFFRHDAPFASLYEKLCRGAEKRPLRRLLVKTMENAVKKPLFSCQECGDCAIQHVGYFCPESQCPKHTRNGPCGGSLNGMCEVHPDTRCVWVRAYRRWASVHQNEQVGGDFVPPRNWALSRSCSWINFHLRKDHQGAPLMNSAQRKQNP
ncbi:MAG: methylenetetrahydrofolate reductase C-terminal domain-containing protein [Deltaproteobacteria bacterium]|nr:methylenetetrahydrofolate reductase C-terminal domain-containing protein [Deltaproteobacteria bacterium]